MSQLVEPMPESYPKSIQWWIFNPFIKIDGSCIFKGKTNRKIPQQKISNMRANQ